MLIVLARPVTWHGRILAAWLLGTAVIYFGAALSIDQMGLAVEILDCTALIALSVSSDGFQPSSSRLTSGPGAAPRAC
jgi:hypothetical protein